MAMLSKHESRVQLGLAVIAGFLVWLTAADFGTRVQHREFIDFFASSAGVIAALLIALVIEARAVLPLKAYAVVAPVCLAVGEVSAVAALSPSLPEWTYRWLLALTVGGGLGGLIAVLWAAYKLLRSEVQATRVDALLDAAARAVEDQRTREAATAGTTITNER